MIDLHCHLLPGVDDGPGDWDGSLALARMLVEQGVQGVVATPHFIPDNLPNPERTAELLAELRGRISRANLALTVYPGAEAYLDPALPQLLAEKKLPTVNNQRSLLLELPLDDLPCYTAEVLFQVQLMGIRPILAHPERNRSLAENTNLLREMVHKGILVQLNAGSLLGSFGQRVQKVSLHMVRHGLVHFLASDAHDVQRRPPVLERARQVVARLAGEDAAALLTWSNPNNCLTGEEITTPAVKAGAHHPFRWLWGTLAR